MPPRVAEEYFSLLPYWASGFALAVSFYFGMIWLGGHFRPEFRQDLTRWLQGESESNWADNFCNLFDTLFGAQHFSLKRVLRSATASLVSAFILYVLLAHVLGVLGARTFDTTSFWQATGVLVLVNIVADYLSLIETRWLLDKFRQVRGVVGQAVLLFADLLFTGAIVILLLVVYSRIFSGRMPRLIEIIAIFSVYSIFFYSTFLTSVWAWLYCASSWFVRLFTRGKLAVVLDINDPVRQIGLVGAGIILIGTVTLGPLLRSENGGIAGTIDGWLCERDLDSCYLAARAARDSGNFGPVVMFMQIACRNERDGGSCAEKMRKFFDEDSQTINAIWARACEGGYPRACRAFGWALARADGITRDLGRAAAMYQRACEGGDAEGCLALGDMYFWDGLEKDKERALFYYQKGCDLGNNFSCSGALSATVPEGGKDPFSLPRVPVAQ